WTGSSTGPFPGGKPPSERDRIPAPVPPGPGRGNPPRRDFPMAIDHLTDEQRALGKDNYARTVAGLSSRRELMKGLLAAGPTVPLAAGAYFGYKSIQGNAVKAALIGGGDEGGVLV